MMHTPAHKQRSEQTLGDYIEWKLSTEPKATENKFLQDVIDLLESGRVSTAVALLKELVR